jgi:hypothetical protein
MTVRPTRDQPEAKLILRIERMKSRALSPLLASAAEVIERASSLRRVSPLSVQIFGRRHEETPLALGRPASKKRQGTKSREVRRRLCRERYGDLIFAPGG